MLDSSSLLMCGCKLAEFILRYCSCNPVLEEGLKLSCSMSHSQNTRLWTNTSNFSVFPVNRDASALMQLTEAILLLTAC